jgi:hypothetical protein
MVIILMKNMPCTQNDRTFVIRLTEDILIDSFVMVNKEFYSSQFEKFAVYGNIQYPSE